MSFDRDENELWLSLICGTENEAPLTRLMETELTTPHLAVVFRASFGFSTAEDNPYSHNPTRSAFLNGARVFSPQPFSMSWVRAEQLA